MYRTVTPDELDIQTYDSWEEFSKRILVNLEETTLGDLFKSSNVDAKVITLAENMLKRIFSLPNVFYQILALLINLICLRLFVVLIR